MFNVGQNGKLRLRFLNAEYGLILRLNGQGNDLCLFFFKLAMVFCQPNELVNAWPSIVSVIKDQDDQPIVKQFIG